MTFVEDIMEDEELLRGMLLMPEEANQDMIEVRRESYFSYLWRFTDMEKEEVLELIKEVEDAFVDEYGNGDIPEFALRAEAHDVFTEWLHGRFDEEGLLVD